MEERRVLGANVGGSNPPSPAMDKDEIQKLIDTFEFKGWPGFTWTYYSPTDRFTHGRLITHKREDDLQGKLDNVFFIVPIEIPELTPAGIAFAAYVGVLWYLEHEARERFYAGGEQPVYPHHPDGSLRQGSYALTSLAINERLQMAKHFTTVWAPQ